jgi:hypothetical protein
MTFLSDHIAKGRYNLNPNFHYQSRSSRISNCHEVLTQGWHTYSPKQLRLVAVKLVAGECEPHKKKVNGPSVIPINFLSSTSGQPRRETSPWLVSLDGLGD